MCIEIILFFGDMYVATLEAQFILMEMQCLILPSTPFTQHTSSSQDPFDPCGKGRLPSSFSKIFAQVNVI